MAEAARFPWRWFFAGSAALVVLCVLGGWWWLGSTGDLDAFEKRARAAGVDLEPLRVDPAAVAAVESIARKAASLPYASFRNGLPGDPGFPARFMASTWDAPLAAIDRLPPGATGDLVDVDALVRLIAGRIAFGAPDSIPLQVHRLLLVVEARGGATRFTGSVVSRCDEPISAFCIRSAGGEVRADPALLDDLEALAGILERDLRTVGATGMRVLFQISHRPPGGFIRDLGLHLPELYDSRLGMRVFERCGRGPALDMLLAWQSSADAASDLRGILALKPAARSPWDLAPTRLLRSLSSPSGQAYGHAMELLRIRQLLSDLRNLPAPEDPCGPPGARLRPVVRDGRRIGVYSVGPDGVDDGGHCYKDLCIRLGGGFGFPRMGDPLPPPPVERFPSGR